MRMCGMKNKRCKKCGYIYDAEIYGDLCPFCRSEIVKSTSREKGNIHSEVHKRMPCVYGPPPIKNDESERISSAYHSTIYGPPPIDCEPYQEPHPVIYGPSPVNTCSCSLIIFIIGVLLSGIIVWLLGVSILRITRCSSCGFVVPLPPQ